MWFCCTVGMPFSGPKLKKKKKMQTADGDTFVIVVHYETTTHFNVVDCLGELQQKQVGNKSGNCIRMCINYLWKSTNLIIQMHETTSNIKLFHMKNTLYKTTFSKAFSLSYNYLLNDNNFSVLTSPTNWWQGYHEPVPQERASAINVNHQINIGCCHW